MDPNLNEDATACLAIIQNPEVIIDDGTVLSNEVIVEDCTVEIQSSDIEFCPPYVEQTIELDSTEEIIGHIDDNIEIKLEQDDDEMMEEQINTDDMLIPTAECEVEIEQEYEFNCVYVKEEVEDLIDIQENNIEDDEDSDSNDNFCCNLCDINFETQEEYINHKKQHAKYTNKVYECSICSSLLPDTKSLTAHMVKEHPENGNFFACGLCDKTFKRKFNLDYHLLQHCKPKPTMMKCGQCSELFTTKSALQYHMLRHRSGTTPLGERLECKICNKTFQKSYLRVHMTSHLHNSDYTCNFCNKQLSSKQSLYMHMNTVHANEGCYQCSYCEKRFFWKSYLDRHITVHTKEKSHHCNMCTKSFTRKLALRKHVVATHMGAKGKYNNFSG